MANGTLKPILQALGQVAHTDGTATTVVQLALPVTSEGIWCIRARCASSPSVGRSNGIVSEIVALVHVDFAVTYLGPTVKQENMNGTGYAIDLVAGGSDVYVTLQVTAANGYRSVGLIEAFGVEQDIAAA